MVYIFTLSSPIIKEGFFILLLECSNIKKYFQDRLILEIENLIIYFEDRIGIIGVNGAGKTTLINILCQRLEPDEGWVKLYGRYSYISQIEPPDNKIISADMASKFGVASIWSENMSGGEKNRFKIADSFGQDSQILFADEPTSNVDMEGIELMEGWFAEYQGAMLIISHDRSFLNKLCNKILEIENGKVKIYKGNYDQYRVQKAQEQERAQFEYFQYVNEKKRLEEAIVNIRQKAKSIKKAPKRMGNSEARLHKMGNQKAKASLERAKKNIEGRIEHMEVKEKPIKTEEIKFDLPESKKIHSKIIIEGNRIHKAFADKIIFQEAEFKIPNGAKVALIGPNGCGKSTLLKMIIQQDAAVKIAPAAKIGYFSQNMNILDEKLTILENVMENSIYQQSFVRTLLARLLFKREDVYKKVNVLSGGERVKVSFAKILVDDFNLLILDEPTNYLDIKSLEIIEEALRNYNRTLLFVSHDRSFISSVADHIMIIENKKIKMFQGNYTEYLNRKSLTENQAKNEDKEDIENQILILQHRLSEIIGRLSMPSRRDNLEELDHEYHEIIDQLKKLKS